MDTIYNIEETLRTERTFVDVFTSLEKVLGEMGGTFTSDRTSGSITVIDGKGGLFGDFLMETEAHFTLKEKVSGEYLLVGSFNKKPSMIFWICLVGGICLFWNLIGWAGIAGVIIYFMADLGEAYKKKINIAMNELSSAPVEGNEIEKKEPEAKEPSEEKPKEAAEPPSE